MNKSEKVLLLSNIVLIGFVIAVVFHYAFGFYLNSDYPNNTFLYVPNYAFSDFLDLLPKIKDMAPYTPPATWQNYFPLSYLVLLPFAYIKNKFFAYFVFISIFISFFLYTNIKKFTCKNLNAFQNIQNIFILSVLSYPFLYVLDRGNFDMIILIFFAFFIFFFQEKKYQASAIMLGIINAFKPFSLMFLIMFLIEKKYKEFLLSIGTTFLLILGGFMVFKGNVLEQISVLFQSYIWIQKIFILEPTGGISNSSSLFMAVKLLLCNTLFEIPIPSIIRIYSIISLLVTLIVLIFSFKEKIFWKKVSLLTLYMLTIPSIVFDYKLILLFVPIWLFVNAKGKSKFDLVYTILFGLLLIPKRFILIWIFGHGAKLLVGSVFINPLIMLIFMSMIITEQFYKKESERELKIEQIWKSFNFIKYHSRRLCDSCRFSLCFRLLFKL